MYEKVFLKDSENLKSASNQYNTQKMFEKAFESFAYVLDDVPNYYKTKQMRKKAVDRYPYEFPDQYKEKLKREVEKSCFMGTFYTTLFSLYIYIYIYTYNIYIYIIYIYIYIKNSLLDEPIFG